MAFQMAYKDPHRVSPVSGYWKLTNFVFDGFQQTADLTLSCYDSKEAWKERRPVGASDDPRHPAVKGCGATERRARNGGVPGLPVSSARPAPVVATPDGAIHPATRPALSRQQLRQSLLLV